MHEVMDAVLTYRGRSVSPSDVSFIRELIASKPGASRRALSFELCAAWNWVQPNGMPRDMVCRGLMLALHRAGHIELPPAQWRLKGAYRREAPVEVDVDRTRLSCGLPGLGKLRFEQVRRTEKERLFNGLIEQHHYLGYTRPVGEHLKYLVYAGSRPFNELCQIVNGLLVLTRPEEALPPEPIYRKHHKYLEYALSSLAKLCRDRGIIPCREYDIQQVLHSHLEGIFDDYVRSPTIDKPLLKFKPDGGVQSLKAAIECKYVASEKDLKTAIHGLTEDLSGYAGSENWNHFYTVVYMTEAFSTEGQVQRALGASGNAGAWTMIVVTGAGKALAKKKSRKRGK